MFYLNKPTHTQINDSLTLRLRFHLRTHTHTQASGASLSSFPPESLLHYCCCCCTHQAFFGLYNVHATYILLYDRVAANVSVHAHFDYHTISFFPLLFLLFSVIQARIIFLTKKKPTQTTLLHCTGTQEKYFKPPFFHSEKSIHTHTRFDFGLATRVYEFYGKSALCKCIGDMFVRRMR